MNLNDGCAANATDARNAHWGPNHLSFACLLNGLEPVALDKPFTYIEIGAGEPASLDGFAASAPHAHFYTAQCTPRQDSAPRHAIDAASPSNLTRLEKSVVELAQGATGLPQFDFIVARCDFDRIPFDTRRHVVAFIARHLKPGGIVYAGYNAMPGAATGHPLQRLMLEYAACHAQAAGQPSAARDSVQALAGHGAKYFDANPGVHALWDQLKEQPVSGLNGMEPLYFADVARDFSAAKLDFAGAADPRLAFPSRYLTAAQQDMLDKVADMALRETLKDYICNTAYRADVFVRGARRMHAVRRQQWLERSGLAMTAIRNPAALRPGAASAPTDAVAAMYGLLLHALAERPLTLAELARLPALQEQDLASVLEAAALLVATGQAVPFFTGIGQATQPRHDRRPQDNTEKRASHELE